MIPDYINGSFGIVCGLALFVNCLCLYRDKCMHGVSWMPTLYLTAWGYWNLYYFPCLNQWFSFAGACLMATANTLWLSMMLYYEAKKR